MGVYDTRLRSHQGQRGYRQGRGHAGVIEWSLFGTTGCVCVCVGLEHGCRNLNLVRSSRTVPGGAVRAELFELSRNSRPGMAGGVSPLLPVDISRCSSGLNLPATGTNEAI